MTDPSDRILIQGFRKDDKIIPFFFWRDDPYDGIAAAVVE
jgi:hypothetical protein